jgi:hypothetical protein
MFGSLIIGWFLTFGYIPQQTECVNNQLVEISPSDMATVAEIGLSAECHPFKIYGSIESYQFFSGREQFYPYRADYKAGIELSIVKGVKIIAEHECDHPVVYRTDGRVRNGYMSQVTRVMVRVDGKME